MYTNISELPLSTKNLPHNGKRIYMKFFNRAYQKFRSDIEASKVAWQAVKRKYKHGNNGWVARSNANSYDTTSSDETTTTDDDDDV